MALNEGDHTFLESQENDQQRTKRQRLIQGRVEQRPAAQALADMQHVPQQDELGKQQGLHDGIAEVPKADVLVARDRQSQVKNRKRRFSSLSILRPICGLDLIVSDMTPSI